MPPVELAKPDKTTFKDFVPDNEVRWCPGCGDYAILNTVQKVFPSLGIPREKFVVVSGIGCSSRFPYYMHTYGFHTIHGRAPTIATGIKVANPELSVWIVTGDGDGLSIGGNHLLHVLRRNLDVTILLFNNRIYGLTKGQYSPTSEMGKKSPTSPMGSIDHPINPLCFALAAEATFVARTLDTNPRHMAQVFTAAAAHKGTAFVEILQNCVIYNHDAFADISARSARDDQLLMLGDGQPLIYGKDKRKGIRLNGLKPEIATIGEHGMTEADMLIHDQHDEDPTYAYLLTQMNYPDYPTPMGVFRDVQGRPTYDELILEQTMAHTDIKGKGKLQELLTGSQVWEVAGDETSPGHEATPLVSGKDMDDYVDEGLATERRVMRERKRDAVRMEESPILRAIREPLKKALHANGMVTPVVLGPNATVAEAIDKFKRNRVDCLLIMDGGKLVGILSGRDVLQRVALKSINRENTPVRRIMTPSPATLNEDDSIGLAFNKLSIGRFRHMPIVCRECSGEMGLISVIGLLTYIHDQAQTRSEGQDE